MRAIYVVRSNALAGKDDAFNRWYDETHLPEVLQIEGVNAAQRFRLSAHQLQPDQAHQYLAIYDIDSDDVEATLERLKTHKWSDLGDAIDPVSIDVVMFESLGDAVSN